MRLKWAPSLLPFAAGTGRRIHRSYTQLPARTPRSLSSRPSRRACQSRSTRPRSQPKMIDRLTLSGVDPYDALRSPRMPGFVRRSARLRQLAVQVRKRVPWDLAGLLGIEAFVMAKTVGCFLSALARETWARTVVDEASMWEALADAQALVEMLDTCEGYSGNGAWGYEFDVQTRWAFYPKEFTQSHCNRVRREGPAGGRNRVRSA